MSAGGRAAETWRDRRFTPTRLPNRPGCGEQPIRPAGALYRSKLHEFLLMYDDVRRATSPRDEILEFAQSTYEAGANFAGWDRASLERLPLP